MESCLLDTNVLLRLVHPVSPQHALVRDATNKLSKTTGVLCFTSQNLAEFWNVCTRPEERNGLGLSIDATEILTQMIEQRLMLVPENEHVHGEWRRLVLQYRVSGTKVHDARLIASMHAHRISGLMTLNAADFLRYKRHYDP
jgi:predicted nucleic acid-binding protein